MFSPPRSDLKHHLRVKPFGHPSMRINGLLTWISNNEIRLHSDTSVVESDRGVAVYSAKPFHQSAKVATIPKNSVLSVRTCARSEQISWAPYGHGAVLALSLALYSEILNGAQSRWHGYLQSLPANIVPIARLWGHPAAFPDDTDAQQASRWSRFTEIQKELQDEDGTPLLVQIDDYYASNVEPPLLSHALRPSLAGFLRAYSLVCSRAFLVDAYHGLSMVPIADAFNHAPDNHVQLASEYDVCPECGCLVECPHDQEDISEGVRLAHPSDEDQDTVDMVTVRPVPSGVEIFNTYGADLGNAALLARYGFMLGGCEADTVTFGWPGSGLVIEDARTVWVEAYNRAKGDLGSLAEVSSLVYQSGGDRREPTLSINSDGQVSLALFVWAVRNITLQEPSFRLHGRNPDATLQATAEIITRTFRALVQVEARGDIDDDADADPIADALALRVLVKTAGTISDLCRARLAQMGQTGDGGANPQLLGEILDDLPPEMAKTRYALEYLLSECAILDVCAAIWEELRETIGEASHPGLDDEAITE